MSQVHYAHCPLCGSTEIYPVLAIRDHSVSGEEYAVWECSNCLVRFTQDVPDENSMEPFYRSADYISHSDTAKGFVNKLYKIVRRYTLHYKALLIIRNTVKKGMILDVGAGTGAFLSTMKNKGWEVTGIEPDLGAGKQALKIHHLELLGTDSLDKLPAGLFDAITLWHVLEHVHNLHAYLDKLSVLLSPTGKLFVAVPNYSSTDAEIYKKHWAAYDIPRHLYHFHPASIQSLMTLHGLKVKAKKPMWFDSFYISLVSSRYKNGKTNWPSAIFNGLLSNISAFSDVGKCSSVIYIMEKDQ